MDRGDAPRMARVPGIKKIKRGFIADFANLNARRAETERLFEAFRHSHFNGGVHGDDVFSRALDFTGIFNDDMAFIGKLPHHLGNEGIGEGGFPRSGPTDHKGVLMFSNGEAQRFFLAFRHGSGPDVFIKGKDP